MGVITCSNSDASLANIFVLKAARGLIQYKDDILPV